MSEETTEEDKGKFWDKMLEILDHKKLVKDNCVKVAKGLVEEGKFKLAQILVARGFTHDLSKLSGLEFDYLHDEDISNGKLTFAIMQHSLGNSHHPEYWGGIESMSEIDVAEMVCDWGARATKFGTSLREWIDGEALKRYNFKKGDKTYKIVMHYTNLLCDKPFENKKK